MDFFESQDQARRLSHRLVLLFGLAVASIIVLTYLVVAVTFGVSGLFDPVLFGLVAVGTGMLIGGGTAFRTAQLRKGGPAVAELLGGRRVDPSTSDPDERRLMNVVEEMAIASGMAVPAVYVMDGEPGINAFAAGHTTHDAAVAVTRGALRSFTRDELQGVVAHEFSHILNGDMRLNVRLMGLLFGILLLSVIGRGVLRGAFYGGGRRRRGRNGGGGGQIMILGLALVLLGWLGVFFGRLIQAAVSRQREFLADAAAVQFTRNPQGIADALKRVGASSHQGQIQDHHAQEASHLFFANGVGSALSRSLATHPPLDERIRRIDPRWDGSLEVRERPDRRERTPSTEEGTPGTAGGRAGGSAGGRSPLPFPFPGMPGGAGAAGLAGAASLAAAAGASPEPRHVAWARDLLEGLPEELRTAIRTPAGALATTLGLLLNEGAARDAQLEAIEGTLGADAARRADDFGRRATALGPQARLPLLELALPALRELDADGLAALRRLVPALIREDGAVRTFDFALYHVLRRNVFEAGGDRRPGGQLSASRLRDDVRLLVSAIARAGSGGEEGAREAFAAALAVLVAEDGFGKATHGWELADPSAIGLGRVDEALERVERAPPLVRRAILRAGEAAVLADEVVEAGEVEMLRAVAEALDAPMPPMT